jgi:type I restriction enzyme M protein
VTGDGSGRTGTSHQQLVGFIWGVADLLRGDYKQSEYGRVILPLTVLRRLDSVLAPTKASVLATKANNEGKYANPEKLLRRAAEQPFYNDSPLDFRGLLADPANVAGNLRTYIGGFSAGAADVVEKFGFDAQITRLADAGLLYQILARFADLDLHPRAVSNRQMGYVFEELIRRFSEASNETAGEHFTPREVIRLMVTLLMAEDAEALTVPGVVRTMYDCACGTGGMLSVAEEWLTDPEHGINPKARLQVFGQELNGETYAICRSDMMLKGQSPEHIVYGNSFSTDGHAGRRFDYLLTNPPFGVEWKKVERAVRDEAALGHAGRFGAGLPRINDGSLLFLQHMLSKFKPVDEGGSRLAIVFNGSPLFTGAAGSGESEIRRWVLENDLLEGIVALPDQLFYNTGISTYFWILSNRKRPELAGKVVLLDARDQFVKMRKSLGEKRKEISESQIAFVSRLYADAVDVAGDPGHPDHSRVKVMRTSDFGYRRITVERPLRLRFAVTDEAVEALRESRPFKALAAPPKGAHADAVDAVHEGEKRQALLVEALQACRDVSAETRADFDRALTAALAERGLGKLPAPLLKAVWTAVSVPDDNGELQTDAKGRPLPDPDERDYENVPLDEDVEAYIEREVLPHVPDAWVDHSKTKVGYEIPFTRHFYKYVPPRPLAEIDAEIKQLESEIQRLLAEVTE